MISYAQNFEDVMLWRALKHVKQGFYIDVGANDPVIDSVTKHFYDQGWRGINVEPLLQHFADLQRDRPHDLNLQIAIGEKPGHLQIWEADVRGWATADSAVIHRHQADGHQGKEHTVEMQTMQRVCEEHTQGDIHFLKIDVEGLEKNVLEGANFQRFRPWIVVVEATVPNSTVETYLEWEPILFRNAYSIAYADGLNRYYVANEKAELLPLLRYPPNVFDQFEKHEHIELGERIGDLELQLQQSQQRASAMSALNNLMQASLEKLTLIESRIEVASETTQHNIQQAFETKVNIEDLHLKLLASEQKQQATQNELLGRQSLHEDAQRQLEVAQLELLKAKQLVDINEQTNEEYSLEIERIKKQLHGTTEIGNPKSRLVEAITEKLNQAQQALQQQYVVTNERDQHIAAFRASRSWRITYPLRVIGTLARKLRAIYYSEISTSRRAHASTKGLTQTFVSSSGSISKFSPRIKQAILRILSHSPRLKTKLIKIRLRTKLAKLNTESTWEKRFGDVTKESNHDPNSVGRAGSVAPIKGHNTAQKSPLELYFKAYR